MDTHKNISQDISTLLRDYKYNNITHILTINIDSNETDKIIILDTTIIFDFLQYYLY